MSDFSSEQKILLNQGKMLPVILFKEKVPTLAGRPTSFV